MVKIIDKIAIKAFEGAASVLRGRKKYTPRRDELHIGNAAHLYHPKHQEPLYLPVSDGLQHRYVLGASGSGKSSLLYYLIIQDIQAGRGICLIDPHGDLYQQVLSYIAGPYLQGKTSAERQQTAQKLVLIDPSSEWITGFNPLEAAGVDPYPLATEFVGFLRKYWSDTSQGARTNEIFTNMLITLSMNGLTLLEAKKLLTDPQFRERLVANLPEGETAEYWRYRYNALSKPMQATYSEPILNRLSVFLSDPTIRLMVGVKESTINFRQIMDQGGWLLANFSKGRLKSNADLLGGFFIGKLKLYALSRVDVPQNRRTPFFLYIDEFQNMGDDFETILSEARKYGLGLTLAHQNLDQIDRKIRSAILGNTLTQVYFMTSNQDAATLAAEIGQSDKSIIQRKLVNLKQRQAFFKKKGEPARLMTTAFVPPVNVAQKDVQELITRSMSCHARPRAEVEKEIANRSSHISERERGSLQKNLKDDPNDNQFAPDEQYQEFREW